jgi:glycine/D-amino acid oxidase-like deaminating enzyme/nitrite reductase/ring-hydroxylating ferredoxin subunit
MTSFWLDTDPVRERGTPLADGERHDTAVVGAGLTGVATALLLARTGQRVCLLEARSAGAVATGNTTAKVSLLQGANLSEVRRHHGDEVLGAYVHANLAGQAWLREFLVDNGLDHQVRTAYTYASGHDGVRRLDAEVEAATGAGLPVEWSADAGLPYDVAGAIELPGQLQLHPTALLNALLAEFVALGGVLHTGCRVHQLGTRHGCRLGTASGSVSADRVVLATGTPILDRGGHFARLQPQRSYALAFRVPGPVPQGMYLSIDSPSRSLRTTPGPDGDVLLVGGNGHGVGRDGSTRARVDDLDDWTRSWFPGAVRTHAWSAQDYRPAGMVPLVGPLPLSDGRVLAATGYAKWGMTNGVAAALRLAGWVAHERPAWAEVLDGVHASLVDLADGARFNAEVAAEATRGWLGGEVRALPEEPPGEGSGVVGRLGARPAARSTVDGRDCTVSAICTHLGGVLAWNDQERSWDCPLHGSRFDASGQVLEGPAVTDLEMLDPAATREIPGAPTGEERP